jgi:hypothetical protein
MTSNKRVLSSRLRMWTPPGQTLVEEIIVSTNYAPVR